MFFQGFYIFCGSRYRRNGEQIGGGCFITALNRYGGMTPTASRDSHPQRHTNSFKFYTWIALSMIEFESTGGFEIGMEIVVKAYLKNLAITEVPTVWKDRYEGESNFRLWEWLSYYLKWYFTLLLRRPFFIPHEEVEYNRIRPVGS